MIWFIFYPENIERNFISINFYLVRDINSPIYFHQSTNTFLSKFGAMKWCCEMHFDVPSRFRKGWTISIQKKQWINKYFDKKNRGFVIDITNKTFSLVMSPSQAGSSWRIFTLARGLFPSAQKLKNCIFS